MVFKIETLVTRLNHAFKQRMVTVVWRKNNTRCDIVTDSKSASVRRSADENLTAVAESASFSSYAGRIAHGKLSPAARLKDDVRSDVTLNDSPHDLGQRGMDIIVAVPGLLVSLPVFVVAAIAIKASSRGPIFFRQERIGYQSRPFLIIKLRTMHQREAAQANTSVTLCDDPRVFYCGKILRKFKIDELPQLVNVLRGTMSIVGPRPTVREDYLRMDTRQRHRFRVRPGLTGLAQARGNTSLSWPERIELDLLYVKTRSLWLDCKIIGETIKQVITGRADTHPCGESEWEKAA